MEYIFKRCVKCGALVRILKDCKCLDCGIRCCNKSMETLLPNSVDASFEKHIPAYEIKDNKLYITINHVMDDDHFIEWICIVSDNEEKYTYFKPGDDCFVVCDYLPGCIIYSYCNKHGLWKKDVQ